MAQETQAILELDVVAAPHARVVARTDGAGALVNIVALDPSQAIDAAPSADGIPPEARLALSVDLVAAALARLGELRHVGRLRSALISFEGAVMAIGRDERERSIVVIGDAGATPGLVLSHLHRALAKHGGPTEGR
jgi:hypothetical protein